jgi:hypothetical protein
MSVPHLREAAAQDDLGKLIRFVRLHLGDGNEAVGQEEISIPVDSLSRACESVIPTTKERLSSDSLALPTAFLSRYR